MAQKDLFLESFHQGSGRFAEFEDDGISAWLYLTESGGQRPVGDAWVFNRISAPRQEEIKNFRGGPPPAPIGFAGTGAQCATPHAHEWTILWSQDGESVAMLKDGLPVACIFSGGAESCSRELLKAGPWGKPWSDAEFNKAFGRPI